MIGIKEIGSYIPDICIDNVARAAQAGKDESFIRDKIGFTGISRKSTEEDTSDLCVKAFAALKGKCNIAIEEIDCLVVCTQNPDDYGLPHTSAIVHAKLGLPDTVAVFDISLGCSGFVYALDVIQGFMMRNGMKSGLLFTADPYSKIIDPDNYDTELLFGDGACVTWIGDNPRLVSKKGKFASNGKLSHSICVRADSGRLEMLGNNVFKFAMTAVPKQVEACLLDNDFALDDIDLFLFHQGSKYIVDNLALRMKIPLDKAPFLAQKCGNTVSSTIPLMLEQYLYGKEQRILISGFGVGLSWATNILERP